MDDVTNLLIEKFEDGQAKQDCAIEQLDKRMTDMEVNHARMETMVQQMTSSIKELVGAGKMALFSLIGILAGFFMWYIQNK